MTGVVLKFPAEPAYTAQLHRYLMARMRNRADVEDVMQEAYLRYLQLPKDYAVMDPAKYVFIIAANLVKTRYTSRKRCPVVFNSEIADQFDTTDEQADACRELVAREELARVLKRMQPRCREVLLLNKRDGLHYEVIAEMLGVAPNTVLNAIGRALMQARQTAGEEL
jgi:RNA polymerase sigma-70 factor (ECF subfamily)